MSVLITNGSKIDDFERKTCAFGIYFVLLQILKLTYYKEMNKQKTTFSNLYKLLLLFSVALIMSCGNGAPQSKSKSMDINGLSEEEKALAKRQETDNCVDSTDEKTVRKNLEKAVRCIVNNDAKGFAACCEYPIERMLPIHAITNEAEMIKYFDILFDDSIKAVLKNKTAKDWEQVGWRGLMFEQGNLWGSELNGKITSINFHSAREQKLFNDMVAKDMARLDASLQGDWVIDEGFKCPNGYTVRIDRSGDYERFRIAIFFKGTSLHAKPDIMMFGELEIEGSIGNRHYTFKDDKGNEASYWHFYTYEEGSSPFEFSLSGEVKYESTNIKLVYWDEL